MSRNYDLYLQDIVAADRIASYVAGMTRSEFETDQMRVDAVIRNLQIISFDRDFDQTDRERKEPIDLLK